MSKILTNLYLGEATDANNKKLLDELKITHILIVARELPEFQCQGYEYLKISASDSYTFDLKKHFEEMNKFIEMGRSKGAVLVHCMFGISRSATAVIAYVMFKKKISFKKAFALVSSKRKIQPNENFVKQLVDYSNELLGETNKPNLKTDEGSRIQNGSTSPFKNIFVRKLEKETCGVQTKLISPSPTMTISRRNIDRILLKKPNEGNLTKNEIPSTYERYSELKISRSESIKKAGLLQNQLGSSKMGIPNINSVDIYAKKFFEKKPKSSTKNISINSIFQRNPSTSKTLWNMLKNTNEKTEANNTNTNFKTLISDADKKTTAYSCASCENRLFTSNDLTNHSKTATKDNDKCTFLFLKSLFFFTPKKESYQLSEIKCPKCEFLLGDYRSQGMLCSCGAYVQNCTRISKKFVKMD